MNKGTLEIVMNGWERYHDKKLKLEKEQMDFNGKLMVIFIITVILFFLILLFGDPHG